jgi:hypothetical protein
MSERDVITYSVYVILYQFGLSAKDLVACSIEIIQQQRISKTSHSLVVY